MANFFNPSVAWDIDTNGLTQWSQNDDWTITVDLGFTTTVGNFTGRYVNLCNNGFIEFNPLTSINNPYTSLRRHNGTFPSNYIPISLDNFIWPIIAGLWYDIDTTEYNSGFVYYGQITIGGQKAFRAVWDNVGAFDMTSNDPHYSKFAITIYDVGSDYYKIEVFVSKNDAYQWTLTPPYPSTTVTTGLGLGVEAITSSNYSSTNFSNTFTGRLDGQWIGRNNTNSGLYTFINHVTPLLMAQTLIGDQGEVTSATFYASNNLQGGLFFEARNELLISQGIVIGNSVCTQVANAPGTTLVDTDMKFLNVDIATSPNPYTAGIISAVRELQSGVAVNNIASLVFMVKPFNNNLNFNTVWSSFEYPEYVTSYNDAMSLLVDGQEVAKVGSPSHPISIFQINAGNNAGLYKSNVNFTNYNNIRIDAFTVPIVLIASQLTPNNEIRVILSIANAVDTDLGSFMFFGDVYYASELEAHGWDLILA